MTTTVATLPYRGLRCRELSCQAEIAFVETARGNRMPLEREPQRLRDLDDLRGVFVVLDRHDGTPPVAMSPRAAEVELGRPLTPDTPVYRAHWSACAARDRFRRDAA